ncbi:MAG: hypothetical protein P8Z80_04955 [Pseudolabrys sp.]|jgi:hypothetical protein
MKSVFPIMAALMLLAVSVPAMAQSQDDRQACEGDVYALCGDKIPDQDEIVACLRKHWRKVSKECRHVMINYNKTYHKSTRKPRHKSEADISRSVVD